MTFPNLLKGRLTESLLITLFERAGYRVTRMGLEELFGEVKHLPLDDYVRLDLPKPLRTLPDLLVADAEVTMAYLVEVKFRRQFDREAAQTLHDALQTQREHWPESYAVIMLGEPTVPAGRFHQDYIRLIPPRQHSWLLHGDELWPDAEEAERMKWTWDNLPQLQTVFRRFLQSDGNLEEGFANQQRADFITRTLADLAKL